MALPKLYIDRRFSVSGAKSKIHLDDPIPVHSFIVKVLKALPQYADNATALAGGLVAGDVYNNTTTDVITYVV